jgi:formate dehydrogenase maturation protein FdhE
MIEDGDVWQQAQEAFEAEQAGREWMDAQDVLCELRESAGLCPKCGSYGEAMHGITSSGVETDYMLCEFCEHQWGHQ